MLKSSVRCEIKDADKGTVDVVFATLNVIDSDRDVTLPGAFEDGAKTRISAYGHESWYGRLPVGKGTIREVKNEAIMEGQFFMDTAHGRDTFLTVKGMADLQEWSYGFEATEYKYGEFEDQKVRFLEKNKVHEVSPVLLGAGSNTRTLSAKGLSIGGDFREFKDHADAVVAVLAEFTGRASEVGERRVNEGKAAVSEFLAAAIKTLNGDIDRLNGLSAEASPSADSEEMAREQARYLYGIAKSKGLV